MSIDAFLELLKEGGEQVEGETQDVLFPKFIEIKSFSMNAKRDMKSSKQSSTSETDTSLPDPDSEPDLDAILERPTMTNNKPGESVSDSFTVEITKDVDLASTELFSNYCYSVSDQAMPYDKAIFYFRISGAGLKLGKEPKNVSFLVLELTQPFVYSYRLDTRSTSIPEETVGFYFQTFHVTYKPQQTTGRLREPIEASHALGFEGDGA